jgi:hypothetical protein
MLWRLFGEGPARCDVRHATSVDRDRMHPGRKRTVSGELAAALNGHALGEIEGPFEEQATPPQLPLPPPLFERELGKPQVACCLEHPGGLPP